MQSSALKILKIFLNAYPQPQKTSNFEADTEDPRLLRSQFTTLLLSKAREGCKTPEKMSGKKGLR